MIIIYNQQMLIKIQTFAQKFFVGFVVLKNNPTDPKYFS